MYLASSSIEVAELLEAMALAAELATNTKVNE